MSTNPLGPLAAGQDIIGFASSSQPTETGENGFDQVLQGAISKSPTTQEPQPHKLSNQAISDRIDSDDATGEAQPILASEPIADSIAAVLLHLSSTGIDTAPVTPQQQFDLELTEQTAPASTESDVASKLPLIQLRLDGAPHENPQPIVNQRLRPGIAHDRLNSHRPTLRTSQILHADTNKPTVPTENTDWAATDTQWVSADHLSLPNASLDGQFNPGAHAQTTVETVSMDGGTQVMMRPDLASHNADDSRLESDVSTLELESPSGSEQTTALPKRATRPPSQTKVAPVDAADIARDKVSTVDENLVDENLVDSVDLEQDVVQEQFEELFVNDDLTTTHTLDVSWVSDPQELVENIIVSHQLVREAGSAEFRMRLSPPELGDLLVTLQDSPDGIVAEAIVQKSETLQLIQADLNQLQQTLQDAGVDVRQFRLTSEDNSSEQRQFDNPDRGARNRQSQHSESPASSSDSTKHSRYSVDRRV